MYPLSARGVDEVMINYIIIINDDDDDVGEIKINDRSLYCSIGSQKTTNHTDCRLGLVKICPTTSSY